MRPSFHPQLVNGAAGDPALYVEFLFERRALLFDLGDLTRWPNRKILRISQIFVSHAHVDHFIGFDHFLRICVGRDKQVELYGPPGFIAQVGHKLAAYTWNLVQNYDADLRLLVSELHPQGHVERSLFRCQTGFTHEALAASTITDGVLVEEEALRVRAVTLDHKIPCLAYTLEEKNHINVWKNRLEKFGVPTGPWLRSLKQAVARGAADETPFPIRWRENGVEHEKQVPLGALKAEILRIVPGQKVSYVVDTAYHADNADKIAALAQGSDLLFIEAPFLHADEARAAARHHLTAHQAGLLGRRAGVKRLVPFHFSAKYAGCEGLLEQEAQAAFQSTGS